MSIIRGNSCHHGDIQNENNFDAIKRLLKKDKNREIGIIEIDFVYRHDRIISSHDYTEENILHGTDIEEFIQFIVVEQKRILWCDIKSHLDFFSLLSCDARLLFDYQLLFSILNRTKEDTPVEIEKYIFLSSQDKTVEDYLRRMNETEECRGRWQVISDIPYQTHYITRYFGLSFATETVNRYVQEYFTNCAFTANVVCIDRSFFNTVDDLIYFIETSAIPKETVLILYTFPLSHKRIKIEGRVVIMQYDYTYSDFNTPRKTQPSLLEMSKKNSRKKKNSSSSSSSSFI
jgi:hypothetical protein